MECLAKNGDERKVPENDLDVNNRSLRASRISIMLAWLRILRQAREAAPKRTHHYVAKHQDITDGPFDRQEPICQTPKNSRELQAKP
eukprot:2522010-Amphidinium_carterae.1